ncbi:MAG: adenylate/guanylate cyclase domain-containing protein [Treponema sp.]|jgi:adenylate cyclase|nr:adenylate/guanylate cyclase domain-containing protein [Treponema sp.]
MTLWKNALLGLAAAAVFALLYLAGALSSIEDRLYDFFLRFRSTRPRIDSVVFLDVDDMAIAYNGVYPWPRSIPADGLLRLKEYGARAAIFDIEYIDHGPQGVDSLYLAQGLGNDFDRSFSEIDSGARDFFNAFSTGHIGRGDVDRVATSFSNLIRREQRNLYTRAQGVARDNDLYLAQALAIFGRSWGSLNLREYPLEGEQSERRPIAEESFAYPVNAASDASRGAGFVDILPTLPIFARAAKGAGFTNVEIDDDGVRRRIYLAQNIYDHWYLQLSFSPLIDYLGRPEIILEKRKLTIKQAQLPGGKKDIVIPLDQKGRMLLDWPKEDYVGSYSHISFANFSLLDEIEAELEKYGRALASADVALFTRFDSSLSRMPFILGDMEEYFDAAREAKNHALENISHDSFDAFLEYRNQSYALLAELVALDAETKVQELALLLSAEYPGSAEAIEDEAEYIAQLVNVIDINLKRWYELTESNDNALRDRFCILGRVDTGTTDYGANPFHGKYVNVGTHGVVLDTILSESFIVPLDRWLHILFMLILIPLFFAVTARLSPVFRASAGFGVTAVVFAGTAALLRFAGIHFEPLGTILAMISAVIIREIISYAGSEKEKQFIRTAFSTYVSGDVVKEIISDPSRLQLGGTKRHMTAIFTDVKGFSTISEQLDPEDLVSLLNRYLSAMSDVVLAEKGTIDKYEGDAIIAFFGAPLELPDHALRACLSAINMKKIEIELNKTIMENKLSPTPLLTRIGINTGNMVAGNMGTANKMNYTIMGNAVNLSARLEGVNKQYGTWILTSEDTVRETGDLLLYRKLDRVRVVGINEPVRLCELLDTVEHADEQQKKLVTVFHEALDNFERRNWKQATAGFEEALSIKPDDHPSKMYHERSGHFAAKPPQDDWDGVYNLTSK